MLASTFATRPSACDSLCVSHMKDNYRAVCYAGFMYLRKRKASDKRQVIWSHNSMTKYMFYTGDENVPVQLYSCKDLP